MTRRSFGDRSRFAIEVHEFYGDGDVARRVDVWAAGVWLTCDDNHVYVPHFVECLQHEVARLLADPTSRNESRPNPERSFADSYLHLKAKDDNTEYLAYRFMDWGPTADNVSMLLFREEGTAYLPFRISQRSDHKPSELSQVFVAELPERELALVLHDTAWLLMGSWAYRSNRAVAAPNQGDYYTFFETRLWSATLHRN